MKKKNCFSDTNGVVSKNHGFHIMHFVDLTQPMRNFKFFKFFWQDFSY